MSETESSSDVSVAVQAHTPDTDMQAGHESGREDPHAIMADPVPMAPVASSPSTASGPERVAVKEVLQMVGAMVFVFGFAALGFNAMYHAGY